MWAALWPRESGALGIGFATFLLCQLAFLVFQLAIETAAAFYGFRWVSPLERPQIRQAIKVERELPQLRGVLIIQMFVSYSLCNYVFAVLYVFISNLDPSAFSTGGLSPLDGVYFSVVTAATVGYSDIAPLSAAARLVVVLQISLSLIYVVLLFSACSTYLSRRDPGV